MSTFLELLNNIKSLDIDKIAKESIMETSEAISDYNIDQMNAGIKEDGSPITPSYSPKTIIAKIKKNQVFDRVTLRDKGDFQEEIDTQVDDNGNTITKSLNWKNSKLVEKYGNIFGLTTINKENYRKKYLQKVWNKKIEDITKLKMQ